MTRAAYHPKPPNPDGRDRDNVVAEAFFGGPSKEAEEMARRRCLATMPQREVRKVALEFPR